MLRVSASVLAKNKSLEGGFTELQTVPVRTATCESHRRLYVARGGHVPGCGFHAVGASQKFRSFESVWERSTRISLSGLTPPSHSFILDIMLDHLGVMTALLGQIVHMLISRLSSLPVPVMSLKLPLTAFGQFPRPQGNCRQLQRFVLPSSSPDISHPACILAPRS